MRAAVGATFKVVVEVVGLEETVVVEPVLKSIYMGLMPQITLAVVVVEALTKQTHLLVVMVTVVRALS
jgi:hypothetical protein